MRLRKSRLRQHRTRSRTKTNKRRFCHIYVKDKGAAGIAAPFFGLGSLTNVGKGVGYE